MSELLVRLNASDLWSKFGFGDGDLLSNWDVPDHHKLLYDAVVEYLLPKLPSDVVINFFWTCHNPCRINEDYDEHNPLVRYNVQDIYVDVPFNKILSLV